MIEPDIIKLGAEGLKVPQPFKFQAQHRGLSEESHLKADPIEIGYEGID